MPVGPEIPTLLIRQSIFFVFFKINLNNSFTSYSLDASHSYINSFFLFIGCFLTFARYFLLTSHINTEAPLDKQTFAVAHPMPDAPAEIIIFLFFRVLSAIIMTWKEYSVVPYLIYIL